MRRKRSALHDFGLWSVLLAACHGAPSDKAGRGAPADTAPPAAGSAAIVNTTPIVDASGRTQLVLGSTMSADDSGMVDVLVAAFDKAEPQFIVRLVAVDNEQVLEMGKRKDADVLLLHAPASESKFVADGYGARRCLVMYSDFVIVGPIADPARISGLQDVTSAFQRIAQAGAPFISRGDNSFADRKEKSIWEEAHISSRGAWYVSTGRDMAETLSIAAQKFAYTLSDRATFLATHDSTGLQIMVQGDRRLVNQYGVIPVSGARNQKGADEFATWIISPDAQRMIADYGIAKYGQALFVPDAGGCK